MSSAGFLVKTGVQEMLVINLKLLMIYEINHI